jgi:DNA (cytosine-5)-methyltransferase 1
MSLGFEQAGFDVAVSVELDPIHAATHHFNFPETEVLAQSVAGLDANSISSLCEIRNGNREVDVVFGGPPCQGFSLIGHRVLDDPRNRLVRDFLRLVVDLEARYFVFENVKGLTVGRHRRFLEVLVEEFRDYGYEVALPWHVLNARNYDVPQDRERLFLLGARRGLRVPEYPEPITGIFPDLFNEIPFRPIPTCEEALEDIPDNESFEDLKTVDSVRVEKWSPSSEYARSMHCETARDWFFGDRRKWEPNLLSSSMRTAHTEISRRRFAETEEGSVEPISRFFKLPRDGQCNTLRAGTDSARGAFTSPRPIHYKFDRCVSVREMARLHGYPDWFRFHVTKWHGARQIGNSVPPPLARSIASSVIDAMGIEPKPSVKTVSLGRPDLLAMDMTEAAEYWDVEVPIGKRDRKSGARKRKQEEIEEARIGARD